MCRERLRQMRQFPDSFTAASTPSGRERAVADERGKDLDDIVMMDRRILHEAGKGLNAANPNIQLFGGELFQGPREPVGNLSSVRQAVAARRVKQADADNNRAAH